jgi:phosphate transport system permease protein
MSADNTTTPDMTPSALGHVKKARLARRRAAEWRFRMYGIFALSFGLFWVITLFAAIITNGWTSFLQTSIKLDVTFDKSVIDPTGAATRDELYRSDWTSLAREALVKAAGLTTVPSNRRERFRFYEILSRGVDVQLRDLYLADPTLADKTVPVWLLADSNIDQLMKGNIKRETPNEFRIVKDDQIAILDRLEKNGRLKTAFSLGLITRVDSSQPETAGMWVGIVGTFYMMMIVILLAVPIGVATAAYLEEFAPKNWFTDTIEVNISNLAAVPSIVFGLLGLAVFINYFNLPRSASLVGGLVLTLMTLPTIIIATRAAIRAVPPSIREAAMGVGASKMQTLFHHTLPLAVPGILTGTIIGLVQAAGETAPLLMIGLIAYVGDAPQTPLDPSTAMPGLIYFWSGPKADLRGFIERAAGGTLVLLIFLIILNSVAVILRHRFERKW